MSVIAFLAKKAGAPRSAVATGRGQRRYLVVSVLLVSVLVVSLFGMPSFDSVDELELADGLDGVVSTCGEIVVDDEEEEGACATGGVGAVDELELEDGAVSARGDAGTEDVDEDEVPLAAGLLASRLSQPANATAPTARAIKTLVK